MNALRIHNAGVSQGFNAQSKAVMAPGALDEKAKQLIAMAIGVADVATVAWAFMPTRYSGWAPRRGGRDAGGWRPRWAVAPC